MSSKASEVADLAQRLSDRQNTAYVKALIDVEQPLRRVRYLRAVVGAEPPDWVEHIWTYEQVEFVAIAVPAAGLLPLIHADTESGHVTLDLGEVTATLTPAASMSAMRRPAFAKFDRQALPWPTCDFTLSQDRSSDLRAATSHGFLVAPDAPSFTDEASGFQAFFDGQFAPGSAFSMPSELAVLRCADTRAYLGAVHITASQLSVEVRGLEVRGSIVELSGTEQRATALVYEASETTIDLPDGLPSNAWIWLKRDNEWLDYRALTSPWGTPAELEVAGVSIDVPVDSSTDLERLLAAGEGPQIEYKRDLPADNPAGILKVMKTVGAFANGQGGTIVFGIDPDEVSVLGISTDKPGGVRDWLGTLVTSRVIPVPEHHVEIVKHRECDLALLHVARGQSPPYGVAVDKGSRNKPEFYVRRGASTYPAHPTDLREVVLATNGNPMASG